MQRDLDLEEIESRLYSQVFHSTNCEDNIIENVAPQPRVQVSQYSINKVPGVNTKRYWSSEPVPLKNAFLPLNCNPETSTPNSVPTRPVSLPSESNSVTSQSVPPTFFTDPRLSNNVPITSTQKTKKKKSKSKKNKELNPYKKFVLLKNPDLKSVIKQPPCRPLLDNPPGKPEFNNSTCIPPLINPPFRPYLNNSSCIPPIISQSCTPLLNNPPYRPLVNNAPYIPLFDSPRRPFLNRPNSFFRNPYRPSRFGPYNSYRPKQIFYPAYHNIPPSYRPIQSQFSNQPLYTSFESPPKSSAPKKQVNVTPKLTQQNETIKAENVTSKSQIVEIEISDSDSDSVEIIQNPPPVVYEISDSDEFDKNHLLINERLINSDEQVYDLEITKIENNSQAISNPITEGCEEMLETPDSNTNDFIENDINNLPSTSFHFNFRLIDPDLDMTEKEFNRSVPKSSSIIEYESESNCSSNGIKVPIFNEVCFENSKEIFEESNLRHFSDFIVPVRKIDETEKVQGKSIKKCRKENSSEEQLCNSNNSDDNSETPLLERKMRKKKKKKSKSEIDSEDNMEQNENSTKKKKKKKKKKSCLSENTPESKTDDLNVYSEVDSTRKKKKTQLESVNINTENDGANSLENSEVDRSQKKKAKPETTNIDITNDKKRNVENSEVDQSSKKKKKKDSIHKENVSITKSDEKKVLMQPNEDNVITNEKKKNIPLKLKNDTNIEKETPLIIVDIENQIPKTKKNKREKDTNLKSFKDCWTPDMNQFYEKSWGQEHYDINKALASMPSDKSKWRIIPEDNFLKYRKIKGPFCTKCKHRGHPSYKCPKKNQPTRCSLCGDEGHYYLRCPNTFCTTCGKKSPYFMKSCKNCYYFKDIKCTICKCMGHPKKFCPNYWKKEWKTSDVKPNSHLWCPSCAHKGHTYEKCPHFLKSPAEQIRSQPVEELNPKSRLVRQSNPKKREMLLRDKKTKQIIPNNIDTDNFCKYQLKLTQLRNQCKKGAEKFLSNIEFYEKLLKKKGTLSQKDDRYLIRLQFKIKRVLEFSKKSK